MSNLEGAPRSPRDSLFTAVFTLSVAATACAMIMIMVPRAVPLELPTLMLDGAQVQAHEVRARRLAALPLREGARAVYEHLLEAGRRELQGTPGDEAAWLETQQRAHRQLMLLREDERAALYAYVAQRVQAAIAGDLAEEEARALLGKHAQLLYVHGYVSSSWTQLAPAIALEATHKVRLNLLLGEAPTAQLSKLEQLAYQGFRALEARDMPDSARREALTAFQRLGGAQSDQALLIWAAMHHEPEPLVEHVRLSRAAAHDLKLRNMALTALEELERQELAP